MVNVDITISSDDEKYKLVFLLNEELRPIMCWLEFEDKNIEMWDNEAYLDDLYKYLDATINGKQCHPNWLRCFHDIVEIKGMYEDMKVVLAMYNKAIEIGLWEK